MAYRHGCSLFQMLVIFKLVLNGFLMVSSCWSFTSFICWMKSLVFCRWCDDNPTKGLRILVSSLAVLQLTVPVPDIMGLNGVSDL